jgi:hypothetical protein
MWCGDLRGEIVAVGIEFVNVIVRKAAVERSFPGGLDGFARQGLPNLTEDAHLLRVGFMSGGEAFEFVSELEAAGLCCTESNPGSDIAVVWDGSPLPRWLAVGAVGGHWACWASDHPPGELALPEPGFLLRCPRRVYQSLPEVVRRCGAEVHQAAGGAEPGALAKLRCVREDAEITIDAVGESGGDSPVGLMGWRQIARRAQFPVDVALIRDVVAILRQAGAEE